ncbi:protein MODIFIER OF SNC1 1 isoform X1 [Vigna unguiculata]|uniref:protein MODIFIER OF SNC1 1 isoform X1 n=1 Tax=Vigna unguiculata TaxID=3917 RepID=UPI0010168D9A|nr:protein MODIFIER OF SNC1 1 isoform X1 [Vigna unguiculata]XP_027919032.1 protein MODIFIER OF SNC1 1 isoform X1 [Vigna unguiculata]
MTSSMLSGERRWASSSRRGGMTVLGKVAVPKPINLPSQRLENHGLDPNVEIVPKGTLSWGSRSSSSTSNAWGSSSLSPNADGGGSSPSHLSGRPSSGGSGTRPSTAGSDRVLEPTANSWGTNSRPSSASGVLSKNQSSLTSLRPRSAETRPGSSQLSRFAEPLTENSGAWNAARTTEKLGVTQPKNEEFSLSSGDFPTLGSDKDKSVLNSELQDPNSQAHPDSPSELRKEINETTVIDDTVNANIKGESVNSWRRDYQVYNEEGVRPGIEKWQGNSQLFPNAGIPPQHYEAWHGPPVNNPQGCVWFRGPPSGPPFGNPVTPSGFPMEPFPYYRPHMPPAGLANPPSVPPPGAGPRGHHKNGDVYRPHIADAFIRPGIPMRPGFYPGSMAYEGYYSPPMGYCNANERDVPFMGMAAGPPPVFNRYSNQNPPEPGNAHGRSAGYGNAGKQLTSEQVESGHPPDTAGPYRVLLKQQPESDGRNESTNFEDPEKTNAAYVDGRGQPRMTVRENEQRSNYRKNEEMDQRTMTRGEVSSQTSENQVSSSSVIKGRTPESSGNTKFDDNSARKLEGVASDMLEISHKPSAPKDASLIQKIEGLNAKARDNSSARIREEQRSKFHTSNAAIDHVENTVRADVFPARTHATEIVNPAHQEMGAAGAGKNFESLSSSGKATSRQSAHGMQGRGDHRNKGRSNNQDADGWRKKSVVEDSSALSGVQLEASNVLVGDHQISVQTYDRSGSYNQARHFGESVQTWSDSGDSHAQRAKMKELAKQRTRQLQEEEEERTRKQKAKALAKLDELNKRSQAGDGPTQKEYITNPQMQEEEEEWTRKQKASAFAKLDELNNQSQAPDGSTQKESVTNSAIQNKREELQPSESKTTAVNSAVNCNVMCQINEPSISRVEKSPVLPGEPTVKTLRSSVQDPIMKQNQVVALHHDINNADATNPLHAHNNVASKQKRMSYKQKQNLPFEKTSSDKVVSTTSTALKVENDARIDVSLSSGGVTNEIGSACGSDLPMNSTAVVESSANPKKKNIRNSKNKQKHEETSTQAVLPIPKETHLFKSSVEGDKSKASDFELEQGVLQPAQPLSKDPNQFPEQHRYSSNEESHGKQNSQWKSQHSRRLPRNMQTNRPAEKSHGTDAVMWAPVKPLNKSEIMDELVDKSKTEAVNPVKNEQQVHNSKNKRAEMERYIPKPVAKEMAQQGNILQVASSSSQSLTSDSITRVDSGSQGPQVIQHTNPVVGKVGFGMESKIRDGRHTKQGKAYGSWRQRNMTESTTVHDELDHDSNSELNVQKPTEHHHDHKSEVSFVKGGQTKHLSDTGEIDGPNNSNSNDSAAWASAPVKDHAATGRGRWAPFRGHKGAGGNREVDNKRNSWEADKVETLISSSEHGQPDVGMASKENRVVGERLMSQWQPKSQASNNHRGNLTSDQNVSSVVVGGNKRDPTHDGESLPVSGGKSSNAHVPQPFPDQPVFEKAKAGEAPHFINQEGKKERRNAPSKRQHYSPNLASVTSVEQAPTSADLLQDQRPSSGSGKNVNQNRFRRGHESHGNLKPPTQDNRHYNQPTNRERQGPSMHHEYHPLGPYDDGKSDNFERPKNGNHGERRFRERGSTHSRRGGGNSYGRQGGFESYD